jgi:hypothetical protein
MYKIKSAKTMTASCISKAALEKFPELESGCMVKSAMVAIKSEMAPIRQVDKNRKVFLFRGRSISWQ